MATTAAPTALAPGGDEQRWRDRVHESVEPLLTGYPTSPVRCATEATKRVDHDESNNGGHGAGVRPLDEVPHTFHVPSVAHQCLLRQGVRTGFGPRTWEPAASRPGSAVHEAGRLKAWLSRT
ncbi:MAG: hypothetical protein WKF73_02470 [Nocardioidaceae bacterium]